MIYKKCEVCGKKVNKFKSLKKYEISPQIKCSNCKTDYVIKQNFVFKIFNYMIEMIFTILSFFSGFAIAMYIDDKFLHLGNSIYSIFIIIIFGLFFNLILYFFYIYFLVFIGNFQIQNNIKNSDTLFSKIFKILNKK